MNLCPFGIEALHWNSSPATCARVVYTQFVEFEDDGKYCTAVTNNVQEVRKLFETGFEYVCSHRDEMLFRKRK